MPDAPDIAKALQLRPCEISVLNGAIKSIVEYGIADFLPSQDKGSVNAAKRMIEKGYLTKGKAKFSPPNGWITVRFTEANRQKLLSDAKAAA